MEIKEKLNMFEFKKRLEKWIKESEASDLREQKINDIESEIHSLYELCPRCGDVNVVPLENVSKYQNLLAELIKLDSKYGIILEVDKRQFICGFQADILICKKCIKKEKYEILYDKRII